MRDSSPPRVTIITPSFNQAKYIEQTICSVLEQDYPNIEYIVIDGGSTDGSLEIIRRYESRLAYWASEADQGQTEAINKGFNRARGEILAWLNSDDTYQPGAIREAVGYLQSHPEIGMVYGDAAYIDEEGNVIGRYPARSTDYRGLRRGKNTVTQQSMFLRSTIWRMVGPLDPSFFYAMDYDLWIRIAAVSPIAYHPQMWSNFRLHGDSKSLTAAARCWPEILRVHYREGGSLLSLLVAKYYMRQLLEPLVPLRMKYRLWRYKLERRLHSS